MTYRSIGIIGAGAIGAALFEYVSRLKGIKVGFVLVSDRAKHRQNAAYGAVVTDDAREALGQKVDLVLEAATPSILGSLAPEMLANSDVCGFSCSALADPRVEAAIHEAAARSGRRFFVPHGAVLGLDGLFDGRRLIEKVVITTVKNGASMGQAANAAGVIFEGSAREACARFPRNVNVHAAVALASIGFDRTQSVVIADPYIKSMTHRIVVSGRGLEWDIAVSSVSLGGVTGFYTPSSAVGSLSRILGAEALAIV